MTQRCLQCRVSTNIPLAMRPAQDPEQRRGADAMRVAAELHTARRHAERPEHESQEHEDPKGALLRRHEQ